MPDVEPLEIQVDTEVQVASDATTRRVLDAVRRQLRQLDLGPPVAEENERRLLSLIETRGGRHHMPQALLPRMTETCQRYGVPYAVVDRRAMVACPALRSRLPLSPAEERALRQLLLRDGGVLVTPDEGSRRALALELVARRQQRTLILVEHEASVRAWLTRLQERLGLGAPQACALSAAGPDAWIVVGRYDELGGDAAAALRQGFGLVACDDLCSVDALTVMRTIRALGARYLLGLAASATRSDGLHNTIFLALGGLAHHLAPERAATVLPLALQAPRTEFRFDAYEGRGQYQALVAALAADDARARQIAADVAREARAGRACLVLSERRDHLELLARLLPAEIPAATITSNVRPAERDRLLRRFEQGELCVLWATSQLAESIRTTRAQRVFFTFPFSYARKLEQVVQGLIQPAPGKDDAVLFDYDDPHVDPLHRAFEKRARFLSRLRREVRERAQLELPLDA